MQNTEVAVMALPNHEIYSVEGTLQQLEKAQLILETSTSVEEILTKFRAMRLIVTVVNN